MTFTDDDLKRLKKHLSGVAQLGTYPREKLEALIARLEAVERVIADGDCCILDCPMADEAMDAWRKAAGR
jgi:hypothetical protein